MCCFSVASPAGLIARLFARRVHVSATNIFARMVEPGVQALAYGMNLATAREVAMVLPLPIARDFGEDAVRFVSLEAHPRMFAELASLFDPPARKGGISRQAGATLKVHKVGAFIASYVPGIAAFTRLDPRFRVPDVLFGAVPAYRDYGFTVFQLEPGNVTVHPMGFTFPTREPAKLFFPTVHLHDGRWHDKARFDHALYFQRDVPRDYPSATMRERDYAGLAKVDAPIERHTLRGSHANADIWIA